MILEILGKMYNFAFKDLVIKINKISSKGLPLKNEFDEKWAEEYFSYRQNERKALMNAIGESVSLEKSRFCSIGCGFAGEEFLIVDNIKELILIEPHLDTMNFVKKKFNKFNNVKYFNTTMEEAAILSPVDILYTSGPSNWMYLSPLAGIPNVFLNFIDKHLSSEGIFLARIYGGAHSPVPRKSRLFMDRLIQTAKKKNFSIVFYIAPKGENGESLLCLTKSSQTKIDYKKFLEESYFLGISNNQVVEQHGQSYSIWRRFKIFLALLLYVPYSLGRGRFSNLLFDIKTNVIIILKGM